MKSFALATLAAVAAAWGTAHDSYDTGYGSYGTGYGSYGTGYGHGHGYGHGSAKGGYSGPKMFGKATLGLANQNRGGVLAKRIDLGDHEYGNDDVEYGNDDLELGNDDNEYGTNMGGLGGEQLASNRLLRVGGAGRPLNRQIHIQKHHADMDRGSDHEGQRGHVGYSRRVASEYGPEFGDFDGSKYGDTDTIDLTALNDDDGEPYHDAHDDRERRSDDEARHQSVWNYGLDHHGPRIQGSSQPLSVSNRYGAYGYGQVGREYERGIVGQGKGYSQKHGEGPSQQRALAGSAVGYGTNYQAGYGKDGIDSYGPGYGNGRSYGGYGRGLGGYGGYGNTYGSGYGSYGGYGGYGSGYGSGYGRGLGGYGGYGSGYGNTYGSGYGTGYGNSYGSGYGTGYGNTYGSGYGAGSYGYDSYLGGQGGYGKESAGYGDSLSYEKYDTGAGYGHSGEGLKVAKAYGEYDNKHW
jgi:hypothetical protein